MDYFALIPLVLALAAALLALDSQPYKAGKLTKTGWIAVVAILAFVVGARDVYVKEMQKKNLKALACSEIEPHVTAISKSEEKEQLFKFRGASQSPQLLAQLHKKVRAAYNALNQVANRHISSLELEERKSLIGLITTYAVIDDILSRGYTDFMGSAARIRLRQAEKGGQFELCSK